MGLTTFNRFPQLTRLLARISRVAAKQENQWMYKRIDLSMGKVTLKARAMNQAHLSVATDGKFDFTVGVKDIEVGSEAAAENLKKVFGLEGGSSLQGLSSDNVDITFGTPENGKVKCTAGPNADNADAKTFFMKVRLAP